MLYIVATPIGNLEDMTFRAIRTLKEVDYIFAEDTRVTKKLLDHYEIKNTVYRYDEHTKQHQVANIINLLKEEKILLWLLMLGHLVYLILVMKLLMKHIKII